MSSVSSAKKRTNETDVLKKRIPENPKFRNVKPVVNTGMNSRSQVPQRLKEAQKHQRQDEIFKRIRLSTFVALMVEVGKEELERNKNKSISNFTQENKRNQTENESPNLNSILNGMGELDLRSGSNSEKWGANDATLNNASANERPNLPPYLLLDVRDPDLYEASHIVTAKNYPSSMLCRTCNYESRDLLLYKNVPLYIIVIYDEDETISARVATTLTQRGYDNIFVLTGGLKLAASKFTDGLIIKTLPEKRFHLVHIAGRHVTNISSNEILTPTVIETLELQLSQIVTLSQNKAGQSVSYDSRASTAQTQFRVSRSAAVTRSGKAKPWK